MMNKRYIYRCLLLPLITCIMVGIAGCGNDVTEEEGRKASADGGTYLTVTARGITDQPSADGSYDDYIASLRVLAFDEKGNMLCNALYKSAAGQGVKEWAVVGKDAVSIKEKLGNGGGRYSFCFIANEEGYQTNSDNQQLTKVLSEVTRMDQIENINIMYRRTQERIPGNSPILMSTMRKDVLIRAGENNTISEIGLTRAFAKFELVVENQSDIISSITDVVIPAGTLPAYYTLFEGASLSSHSSFDNIINLEKGVLSSGEFYRSLPVYLPEILSDTRRLEVNFQAGNGTETRSYSVSAGGNHDTGTGDEIVGSLYRNYSYITTASFVNEWKYPILLSVSVNPWNEGIDEDRTWAGASFSCDSNPENANNNNINGDGSLYVTYEGEDNFDTVNDVIFTISITAPVGMKWKPILSNPDYFDVYVNKEKYENQDLMIGTDSEKVEIRVRASRQPISGEKPETSLSFTVDRNDTGAQETLLVRRSASGSSNQYEDGFAGGNAQSFLIILEPTSITTN